jgi:hypothetical protein
MSSTTENQLSSFICRYCDMSLMDEQSWNLHEQKHLLHSELEDENSFIIPDNDTSNNDISITSINNDISNSPTHSFVITDVQSTNNVISYQTNYDKSPTNSDISKTSSNNFIIPDISPTNNFIIPDNSPTNFIKQRPRNNRFVLNEPTKNVQILPKQPSTERRLKFCQHCNKTFFTIVALHKHLQKNHPQLDNNNKNPTEKKVQKNHFKEPTKNGNHPKFFVDYKSSNQNQNSTLTNQQQQQFQGIQQQQQPKQQQHFQGIHSIKRCRFCNLPFVTDKALRQHEKKHIAQTQPATTMSKPQLEAITRTSTATTRPLIATKKYQQQPQGIKLCRYCKLPFVTDTALEKHEQKHIFQNPQFKMAQQTTTTTVTTTQQQSTSSSNGKVFRYILKPLNGATVQQTTVEHTCKFCQTKHQSYDKLLGHIALRHFAEMFESSGWKCSFCSNKFESEKIMLSHIVRAHDILGPMISIMGKKKKKVRKSNLSKLGRF